VVAVLFRLGQPAPEPDLRLVGAAFGQGNFALGAIQVLAGQKEGMRVGQGESELDVLSRAGQVAVLRPQVAQLKLAAGGRLGQVVLGRQGIGREQMRLDLRQRASGHAPPAPSK
jgi:hypothetical protein